MNYVLGFDTNHNIAEHIYMGQKQRVYIVLDQKPCRHVVIGSFSLGVPIDLPIASDGEWPLLGSNTSWISHWTIEWDRNGLTDVIIHYPPQVNHNGWFVFYAPFLRLRYASFGDIIHFSPSAGVWRLSTCDDNRFWPPCLIISNGQKDQRHKFCSQGQCWFVMTDRV